MLLSNTHKNAVFWFIEFFKLIQLIKITVKNLKNLKTVVFPIIIIGQAKLNYKTLKCHNKQPFTLLPR